jgi:hypothetical protein
MIYSQGLRLFYNRGLHLLVSRHALANVALTSQRVRCFSIVNNEMVIHII